MIRHGCLNVVLPWTASYKALATPACVVLVTLEVIRDKITARVAHGATESVAGSRQARALVTAGQCARGWTTSGDG